MNATTNPYCGPGYYSAHPADSDTHLPCAHLGYAASADELASLIQEHNREVEWEMEREWLGKSIRIEYHAD
jgi:hypothetical protein